MVYFFYDDHDGDISADSFDNESTSRRGGIKMI